MSYHPTRCLLVIPLLLIPSHLSASEDDAPAAVEIKSTKSLLTYLDGEREQHEVERGRRFKVRRRMDTYYVIEDGPRQALVAITDVIPVKTPQPKSRWEFVVTTARAPMVIKSGRRGIPDKIDQGQILEVLDRDSLGSTLYVLLKGGRTAEISVDLIRPARPDEQPPPPPVGIVRGPVRLGCEISIDERRNVYVEFVYPGSLGERIGLQPLTRILKVNGEEVHSAADYDRASQLLGGNLRLLVRRYRMDYPEMLEYRDPRNPARKPAVP
jgi:hypothetical protein